MIAASIAALLQWESPEAAAGAQCSAAQRDAPVHGAALSRVVQCQAGDSVLHSGASLLLTSVTH